MKKATPETAVEMARAISPEFIPEVKDEFIENLYGSQFSAALTLDEKFGGDDFEQLLLERIEDDFDYSNELFLEELVEAVNIHLEDD